MEILETVLTYAAMWAPSITAIAGIIATAILAIGKVKIAIETLRASKDEEKTAIEELRSGLKESVAQNQRLQAYNQKLLEELTRIKGYDVEVK